jgi:hypothetical protein
VRYQIEVYKQWLGEAGQALFPTINSNEDLCDLGILHCAIPRDACDLIGDCVAATGIERYYAWSVPPGYSVEAMDEHLALFASDVMPHFR